MVHELRWLTDHQFLDAVAVAMITPGPVVITVAFIGYLVAGTAGAIVASIGIFLPVYIFTIIPAPWFQRHRENPQLQAFAAGATAAASGAIAGAVVVLGQRAIFDLPTAVDWPDRAGTPLEVPAPGAPARGRGWPGRPRDLAPHPWRIGQPMAWPRQPGRDATVHDVLGVGERAGCGQHACEGQGGSVWWEECRPDEATVPGRLDGRVAGEERTSTRIPWCTTLSCNTGKTPSARGCAG